jgi:hypothetical protein|tara:strand:+ start:20856 stop:26402 length:5547 start_codon:yes stop_codon:yes gene_type:complete
MNNVTKVFDSIGFNFKFKDGVFVVQKPLNGYNSLNSSHVGYYIPYIVRSYGESNIIYEVGVGYVDLQGDDIIVKRDRVVRSSSNDEPINFPDAKRQEFFIFANESSFNTGFNNIIVRDDHFTADPVQASYLIDTSEKSIDVLLPTNVQSKNLAIEFKIISGNNSVIIRSSEGHTSHTLSPAKNYIKLGFANNQWHIIGVVVPPSDFSTLSNPEYSILSDPSGNTYSFQFNGGGGEFQGSEVYWSPGGTNKMLLGSDSEASAHTILSTSGTADTVFNNDREASDFLVYGSGTGISNYNMFFAYDGRLGLNIPSGSRPVTVFHVVNNICQEGFRLENRNYCHPANMTLYHKPSGLLSNGTVVGELNLAGKDTNGNKVNYVSFKSTANNTAATTPKGQFDLVVATTNTGVKTLTSNDSSTFIGYSDNNLTIASGSNTVLGHDTSNINLSDSEISINSPSVKLNSTSIILGSGGTGSITIPSLFATNLQSNTIKLNNVSENSILAVDSSGFLSASSENVKFASIPSGRVLTTTDGGFVTGVYSITDYFLTNQNILWNQYPIRKANICLRQIVFLEDPTLEAILPETTEFEVGDQVAVKLADGTIEYRRINSIDIDDNQITGLVVDQNLSDNTVTDLEVYSITRGGFLSMKMFTAPGTLADATDNTLSIRPGISTVFNDQQKNIDFIVYGTDAVPALKINADGSGNQSFNSGIYYTYATQTSSRPFTIAVTSGGAGFNNLNNSSNYDYAASGSFSGLVTDVTTNGASSYYGTRDQNGNVREWIENSNTTHTPLIEYSAGGSFKSKEGNTLRSLLPASGSGIFEDIGFRVASSYGLSDEVALESGANIDLSFKSVIDPFNIEDNSDLYTTSGTADIPTGLNLFATGINNLGTVNYNYRLSETEVTNTQYIEFLNAVASTDNLNLYQTSMSGEEVGGIVRSGSPGTYTYHTKPDMDNKPVVFVNYLSSLRFANWLHNGAPTGSAVNSNTTEDGSYTLINTGGDTYQVTKNSYNKYWLPNIHEWHKAAYFEYKEYTIRSGTSNIMIKRDDPFPVFESTGIGGAFKEFANLSVSGWTYTDKLYVGDGSFVSPTGKDGRAESIEFLDGLFKFERGSYKFTLGAQDNVTVDVDDVNFDGTYGNFLSSNSGVTLSSQSGDINLVAQDGFIRLYSPYPIKVSGIEASEVRTEDIIKINSEGVETATYPGSSGSVIYKLSDHEAGSSDQFKFLSGVLNMPGGNSKSPLYVTDQKNVETFSAITYDSGEIVSSTQVSLPKIKIGEDIPLYSGYILTHQGEGYAEWAPTNYLDAEGVLWEREAKLNVEIYNDKIQFSGNSAEEVSGAFKYTDTIGLVNLMTAETYYVKGSDGMFVIHGSGATPDPANFVTEEDGKPTITVCPSIPWGPQNGLSFVSGLAYSVTKGAYMSMQMDPAATSGFTCAGGLVENDAAPYAFKPTTLNHISIRPDYSTSFNLLGENIDFVIYPSRMTDFHRYEPEIHGVDASGKSVGLVPGFMIDANIHNSVTGTMATGVMFSGYTDVGESLPSGFHVDETSKIYINTDTPFNIGDPVTSGSEALQTYADLTVNRYAYASGLITQELYFTPKPDLSGNGTYVVNAPLTVNTLGQVISQVPETAATVPGKPTSVTGSTGNSSVTLNWLAPSNDGGRVVLNYIIEYSLDGGDSWTKYERVSSIDTSASLTGLQNGSTYIFRISAVNTVGTGEPSLSSSQIVPNSNYPSEVRNLTATRSTLSAMIKWVIPSFGSPFTDYVIEYSTDNASTWSTYPTPTIEDDTEVTDGKKTTLSGIQDAPRYLFRVKAQNSYGFGPYTQIESIGSDPYEPPSDTEDVTSIWDFGKIQFTGVCS